MLDRIVEESPEIMTKIFQDSKEFNKFEEILGKVIW